VTPTSLFGLIVVAAVLGPGYAFLRIAERRNPRPDRSPLLEVTELVTVGGVCTAVAATVALVSARKLGMDLASLARDGTTYSLGHSASIAALFLSVLAGSFALSILAARLSYRGLPPSIRLHSAWHEVLRRQHGMSPYATLELKDGRVVAGPVAFYTVEEAPPDCRDIVLLRPIQAATKVGAVFVEVDDHRLVIRGSDIVALGVQYFKPTRNP
jgi:hypothetical protein